MAIQKVLNLERYLSDSVVDRLLSHKKQIYKTKFKFAFYVTNVGRTKEIVKYLS